ncbi:MAG: serine/threonine protein kinase [Sandaracinaceae bacterium]|nr:serine/threonine protein kinase [Sandaracinaceae bacterium]
MSGHWGPSTILAERYRIVRVIGEGGMGRVYEAAHTTTRRRVAIKAILPEHAGDPELARGLRREAIAVSALEHQHIVQVLDFEVHEGTGFLVMEHLAGESLAERLTRDGRMTESKALRVAIPVARALVAAHEVGIVHRDLKPSNVFLVSRADLGADHVKLLDFGVAKLLGSSPLTELEGHRTRTGAAVGTILYMAPEQAQGRGDVDTRADLYALGRVLFECLTGHAPFEAGNVASFVAQLLTSDAPRVRALRPEVSAATDALVARCLAREPSARFTSAQEVLHALEEAERTIAMGDTVPRESTATPAIAALTARSSPQQGGALAVAALAVAALAIGGVLVALYPTDRAEEPSSPLVAEPPPRSARLMLDSPVPGAMLYRGEALVGPLPVELAEPDLVPGPFVVLAEAHHPEILASVELRAQSARGETRTQVLLVPAAYPDRAVLVRHPRPAEVRVAGHAERLGAGPGVVRVPAPAEGAPPIELVEEGRVVARYDTSSCLPLSVCVLGGSEVVAPSQATIAPSRRRRRTIPATSAPRSCPDGEVRGPSGRCCPVGTVWSGDACRRPLAP